MRLLAEERQRGTLALLYSSPVRDVEIVVGKYLSALAFLAIFLPPRSSCRGSSWCTARSRFGHLFAGYLGLLLLGSATMAIGTLGSALARSQVLAASSSAGAMVIALLVAWMLARVTERPLSDVFSALALWQQHFPPFQSGIVHLRDVVYYLLVTYVGLFGATRVLEARRWR